MKITKYITTILIATLICVAMVSAMEHRDDNKVNVKVNIDNNVNVDNDQSQQQSQEQQQDQTQSQGQSQSNYQNVDIIVPKDTKIDSLDIGEVNFTRLLFPDEAIIFELHNQSVIAFKAAHPIAIYTYTTHGEIYAIDSTDAVPWYDPIYHKFHFGVIAPVDQIPYYTTKGTLVTNASAEYAVIDNRNPWSDYNLVEVSVV
jgi:hypothetical protein